MLNEKVTEKKQNLKKLRNVFLIIWLMSIAIFVFINNPNSPNNSIPMPLDKIAFFDFIVIFYSSIPFFNFLALAFCSPITTVMILSSNIAFISEVLLEQKPHRKIESTVREPIVLPKFRPIVRTDISFEEKEGKKVCLHCGAERYERIEKIEKTVYYS